MKEEYIAHINKSTIEHDIKKICGSRLKTIILLLPALCFCLLLFLVLYEVGKTSGDKGNYVIVTVTLIAFIISIVCVVIYAAYLIKQYFGRTTEFTVVTDVLTEVRVRYKIRKNGSSVKYYMEFQENGKYYLEDGVYHEIYYTWSNFYSMDGASLMKSSKSGDEFYLVMKNKTILCVYNKKMFIFDDK